MTDQAEDANQKTADKLQIINGFKTTDGEFFVDKKLAEIHQEEIDLKIAIDTFAGKYFYGGMSPEDARDLIIEHFSEMIDIVWEIFQSKLPIDYSDC